jgi:hypothetical protein
VSGERRERERKGEREREREKGREREREAVPISEPSWHYKRELLAPHPPFLLLLNS